MSSSITQLTADERAVIARVVDDAPPLTESTRARLAALLKGAGTRPDNFADKFASTIRRAS